MIDTKAFTFIISLAAVINGLGIVRWITTLAEFLRRRGEVEIKTDWAYFLFAGAQFLFHIIFWWSLWGFRQATSFNFLYYLYLLVGPILMYLGTTLLAPSATDKTIDLDAHYQSISKVYWTIFGLVFVWAIFLWPLLVGGFAPTAPIFSLFLVSALILRRARHKKLILVMAFVNWAILIAYISMYAMQLGGVGAIHEAG